jgi:hypothetical protein
MELRMERASGPTFHISSMPRTSRLARLFWWSTAPYGLHQVRSRTIVSAAIVEGERDARKLAQLRDPRCRKSEEQIAEQLSGHWREDHLFSLWPVTSACAFTSGVVGVLAWIKHAALTGSRVLWPWP